MVKSCWGPQFWGHLVAVWICDGLVILQHEFLPWLQPQKNRKLLPQDLRAHDWALENVYIRHCWGREAKNVRDHLKSREKAGTQNHICMETRLPFVSCPLSSSHTLSSGIYFNISSTRAIGIWKCVLMSAQFAFLIASGGVKYCSSVVCRVIKLGNLSVIVDVLSIRAMYVKMTLHPPSPCIPDTCGTRDTARQYSVHRCEKVFSPHVGKRMRKNLRRRLGYCELV